MVPKSVFFNGCWKNSHITQFPLATFARICKNLLVSGLFKVNRLAWKRGKFESLKNIDSPYCICTIHPEYLQCRVDSLLNKIYLKYKY